MSETQAFMRKGYFFQRMDQISRTEQRRDAFLEALQDQQRDYIAILREFGLLEPNTPEHTEEPNRHEAHLRKHWFPEGGYASSAWWQEWQPIEPILRQGYARAFEEAKKHDWWPIDGYWLSTGNKVAVGIGVNEDEHKITLIRVTPPCPTYTPDTSRIAVVEFKGSTSAEGPAEVIALEKPRYVYPLWASERIERRGAEWSAPLDWW
jgi:hypothetical protein